MFAAARNRQARASRARVLIGRAYGVAGARRPWRCARHRVLKTIGQTMRLLGRAVTSWTSRSSRLLTVEQRGRPGHRSAEGAKLAHGSLTTLNQKSPTALMTVWKALRSPGLVT